MCYENLSKRVKPKVIAAAFTLDNQVALDNAIDPLVAVYSDTLHASGFAISESLALWASYILGASGVAVALPMSWLSYLQNGIAPPLDSGDLDTNIVEVLVDSVAC